MGKCAGGDVRRILTATPFRAAKARMFFRSLPPVLREKVRMRVISSTSGVRHSKSPSPVPSPGLPGEGEKFAPGFSRAKMSKRSSPDFVAALSMMKGGGSPSNKPAATTTGRARVAAK
jgi:hypothetical protein